ncbi:MAG: chemotaxis protein CheX [Pirellulales bacterium]
MQVEFINPFLKAVANTFDTMVNCKVERGDISLVKQGGYSYPVSGVIGLTGKAVGTVVINLSEDVAIKAASAMLMMEIQELNDDVTDAVGELANMVAGQAKADLAEFDMSVSLPNVITGAGHEICFPSNTQPISVPFDSDFGPLQLVVGLEVVSEPAGV